MKEIIYKIVWTDRIRIAWMNRYAWRNFAKSNWWLSYCKHEHWAYIDKEVIEIHAHSHQVSLFGLNAAIKIKS